MQDFLSSLEVKFPPSAAASWDNVGLLVPTRSRQIKKVLVSIDLTLDCVAKARALKCDLIINHHPTIFTGGGRGLTKIRQGTPIDAALEAGIGVYALHTQFDRYGLEAPLEVAKKLKANPVSRLLDSEEDQLYKLSVFVPRSHFETVSAAVFESGAGVIGEYDSCGFSVGGVGTFRGGRNTRPFLGKPGKLERTEELKFETVLPACLSGKIISAMLKAHPYQEVAYDLYPLKQSPGQLGIIRGLGFGIVADFEKALTLTEATLLVKKAFNIKHLMITPNRRSKKLRRFGFVPGKGASLLSSAVSLNCDLFITGETGYHQALAAKARGLTVFELGHRESERFFPWAVAKVSRDLGVKTVVFDKPEQQIE